jgi:PAS domain S-box-containing protein
MKSDRYRELFERSADALLIIVGDKFVDCNASAVDMLRYGNKQDLLNKHPSQLSPERQPDGRLSFEKANEMIAIAIERGSHCFEWDHMRADGEILSVEVSFTVITEDNQKTLHVILRDIAEQKRSEEEKHATENKT